MSDLHLKGRPKMAELLGITCNGLISMEQRGLPIKLRDPDGHIYDVAKVMAWFVADRDRQSLKAKASEDKDQLFTRRAEAETRKAEIEVGKLEESLGDIALIRASLKGVIIHQRTMLLGLPALVGRDIDDPEIRVRVVQLVDRRVREALEALSNYDPIVSAQHIRGTGEADDAGDGEPDQAAAKTHGQPVGRTKAISQPRRRGQRPVAKRHRALPD
jgi:hypothetical protein